MLYLSPEELNVSKEKALVALRKMKRIEKKLSPKIRTFVLPNGDTITSNKDVMISDWVEQYNSTHQNKAKLTI